MSSAFLVSSSLWSLGVSASVRFLFLSHVCSLCVSVFADAYNCGLIFSPPKKKKKENWRIGELIKKNKNDTS